MFTNEFGHSYWILKKKDDTADVNDGAVCELVGEWCTESLSDLVRHGPRSEHIALHGNLTPLSQLRSPQLDPIGG